jgi:23S rRNA pseudouridine955/2504/2580 synthase
LQRRAEKPRLSHPALGRSARKQGRIDQLYRLVQGDVVRIPPIRIAEKQEGHVPAAEFKIIFEDSHLLVIDKPAGVAVHGGSGVSFGVIEQLRAPRPDAPRTGAPPRPRNLGPVVAGQETFGLTSLHEQMRDGVTDKRYLTMVAGDWKMRASTSSCPA